MIGAGVLLQVEPPKEINKPVVGKPVPWIYITLVEES
jgi:hypothetical protein